MQNVLTADGQKIYFACSSHSNQSCY